MKLLTKFKEYEVELNTHIVNWNKESINIPFKFKRYLSLNVNIEEAKELRDLLTKYLANYEEKNY